MRSEKDQMTVGKEKSVVEIQFRDIPKEQENAPGNLKQREEKKEVFTKVGGRASARCRIVYAVWKTDMEEEEEEEEEEAWRGGGIISAPRTATAGGRILSAKTENLLSAPISHFPP